MGDEFAAHDHKTFANSRPDWLFVSEQFEHVTGLARRLADPMPTLLSWDTSGLKKFAKAESKTLHGQQYWIHAAQSSWPCTVKVGNRGALPRAAVAFRRHQ